MNASSMTMTIVKGVRMHASNVQRRAGIWLLKKYHVTGPAAHAGLYICL